MVSSLPGPHGCLLNVFTQQTLSRPVHIYPRMSRFAKVTISFLSLRTAIEIRLSHLFMAVKVFALDIIRLYPVAIRV